MIVSRWGSAPSGSSRSSRRTYLFDGLPVRAERLRGVRVRGVAGALDGSASRRQTEQSYVFVDEVAVLVEGRLVGRQARWAVSSRREGAAHPARLERRPESASAPRRRHRPGPRLDTATAAGGLLSPRQNPPARRLRDRRPIQSRGQQGGLARCRTPRRAPCRSPPEDAPTQVAPPPPGFGPALAYTRHGSEPTAIATAAGRWPTPLPTNRRRRGCRHRRRSRVGLQFFMLAGPAHERRACASPGPGVEQLPSTVAALPWPIVPEAKPHSASADHRRGAWLSAR